MLIYKNYNLGLETKLDKFPTVLTQNMFSKHNLKVNNKRQAENFSYTWKGEIKLYSTNIYNQKYLKYYISKHEGTSKRSF